MLKNRIIPCLDVKNGRVVKGINFVELEKMLEIQSSRQKSIATAELTRSVF